MDVGLHTHPVKRSIIAHSLQPSGWEAFHRYFWHALSLNHTLRWGDYSLLSPCLSELGSGWQEMDVSNSWATALRKERRWQKERCLIKNVIFSMADTLANIRQRQGLTPCLLFIKIKRFPCEEVEFSIKAKLWWQFLNYLFLKKVKGRLKEYGWQHVGECKPTVLGAGVPPVQTCHQWQRKLSVSHAWFTLLIFLCLRLRSFSTLIALPLSSWQRPPLHLSIGWSVHLNIRPSGLTAWKTSDIHALAASARKDWRKNVAQLKKRHKNAAKDTTLRWEGIGPARSGSR